MNFDSIPDHLKTSTKRTVTDEPPPLVIAPVRMPEKIVEKPLVLDASRELEDVTEQAFIKLKEILAMPLDKDDEEFATTLRVQMTAVQTVLNTNVRVDEQRMKRRSSDNLGALLDVLNKHERKMTIVQLEG